METFVSEKNIKTLIITKAMQQEQIDKNEFRQYCVKGQL